MSRLAARWARVWEVPGLESRVRVEWSSRLTRSLGRALPARRVVRLSGVLRRRPALLRAVLCHELAHIAAWEQRRRSAPPERGAKRRVEGPHGPTWASLVRAAGFDPVLRVALGKSAAKRPPSNLRWIHRCPVCQFRRVAKRPVSAWRCARCVEAGLAGDLLISRRAA